MTARLAPVAPPYEPHVDDALRRLMGAASGVEPLVLFRTIAHHAALLDRFRQLGSTLLSKGRLAARDREVVIHRTTARCGAAYEWGVHAAIFAPQVGIDPQALWSGAPEDTEDPLLVTACDELHDTGKLTDATWDALRERYADDDVLVELVCVAGFYHLVSFLCGAFALDPEPWAVRPG